MNERIPNELFSAYLDGEATPGERIVVERELSVSADAQQECEEIKQLSALLRELPQEPAPTGLSAKVLQAAEDPTRLAKDDQAIAGGRDLRRQWWTGVGTLTVSVAMLIMMGLLIGRPHSPNIPIDVVEVLPANSAAEGELLSADDLKVAQGVESRRDLADGRMKSPVTEKLDSKPRELMDADKAGRGGAGGGYAGAEQRPQVQAEEAVAADAAPKPNAAFGKQRVAGSPPMEGRVNDTVRRLARKKLQMPAGQQMLALGDEVSEAQIGRVVRELRTSADEIAVVKLTVVDRHAGLDALQELLKRNQVQPVPNAKNESTAKRSAAGKPAVYVTATGEQLESALRELKQDKQFRALQCQAPISFAGLDPQSRARVTWGMRSASDRPVPKPGVYLGAVRKRKDKKHAIKKPIGESVAKEAVKHAPGKPDAAKKGGTEQEKQVNKANEIVRQQANAKSLVMPQVPSQTAQRKPVSRSRQVRLVLPGAVPADRIEKPADAHKSAADGAEEETAKGLPEETRNGRVGNEQPGQMLRVLLVLEVARPATEKPAEPKGPTDGPAK